MVNSNTFYIAYMQTTAKQYIFPHSNVTTQH